MYQFNRYVYKLKELNWFFFFLDFFNCQYLHFKNSEQNYDNLALLFRNSEDDVYVFYDDFGKIEVW